MASYQEYQGSTTSDYPYPPHAYDPSSVNSFASVSTKVGQTYDRRITRTPSPTPSEAKILAQGVIDIETMKNWRFWIRREWLWYYIIGGILVIITTLITIFHTQIVHWLTPTTNWLHALKYGYLVPIGILFVISFPPLFGHEIVAVLCGVVWGLWIGFAIVVAGSFLGEVGNFYAFKYCFRARAEKMEKTNMTYACLARVVREGGFMIALIARLSAIPGHFTTAVFSTCGMNIFVFCIAAILSSPKQFLTVYLGVILDGPATPNSSTSSSKESKIISDSVVAVSILVTILACWWILRKMGQAKPKIIYDRRKARQAKMEQGMYNYPDDNSSTNSVTFNPRNSDSDIPLTGETYQKWDKEGRAVGHAGDPRLYAPQPQRSQPPMGYDYHSGPRYQSTDTITAIQPSSKPGSRSPQPPQQQQQSQHPGREPTWDASGDIYGGIAPIPKPGSNNPYLKHKESYPPSGAAPSAFTPQAARSQTHENTPTQATFPIPYAQPPRSSDITAEPLPSPSYNQQFKAAAPSANNFYLTPGGGGHGQEESTDSYYTAIDPHSRAPTQAEGRF